MPGSDISKLSQKFIQEMNSSDVKQSIQTLGLLIEILEGKPDPEPVEIEIVSNAYQLVEKFSLLEDLLKDYTKNSRKKLLGNKLDSLYNSSSYGTSILFK
jgi:hypothetical protein